MFEMLKTRINQGWQFIPKPREAVLNKAFRGLPEIQKKNCEGNCSQCKELCPSGAIQLDPVRIDIGKCILCGDCQTGCPAQKICFTSFHKLSATQIETLTIDDSVTPESYYKNAVQKNERLKKLFKNSLKLRQVSAAGCNGCEWELNACSNVNFDMQRYGIEFVASPRHADGIVITGPISINMAAALEDTYRAVPEPKIIILAGTCAISGGVFADSEALNREFLQRYPIDLFVPGCPIHPLTFINGILDLIN